MARVEFDDGKDDGALRTIGEVAKALSIKPHVLRYWEQQFPQLEPLKRSGGRRYYRPEDIAIVERISHLVNDEGYTLKGAKTALKAALKAGFKTKSDDQKAEQQVSVPPAMSESLAIPAQATAAIHIADRDVDAPAEMVSQLKTIRANLTAALER